MKSIKAKVTKAALERRVLELEASIASTYYYAQIALKKLSTDHMMASGVVLSITRLGGAVGIQPVMIHDGLSLETIAAISKDIQRSYNLATHDSAAMNPKGKTQ
jgi:hypothetical protein